MNSIAKTYVGTNAYMAVSDPKVSCHISFSSEDKICLRPCNFVLMVFDVFQQPERISGEQYGIHADVWSVGISFMEV